MQRLRASLVCCTALTLLGCATAVRTRVATAPQLVITMDDLPVHGVMPTGETRARVAEKIVAAFKAADVPEVYGFINGAHVEREPETGGALTAWAAAYPLGNHTWSHKNLNTMGAEEFERELVRNEAALQRFGKGELRKWLRFPYLVEGRDPAKRDSVRAILARRGYKIAAVTMDFSDWQWNEAYARCLAQGRQPALDSLESAYLDAVREAATRSRTLSQALYGRDVPQILLTHISAFNARMMPRVLEVYKREGFQFSTLEEAQRDSIYRRDTDPSQPAGPTSLEAARVSAWAADPASHRPNEDARGGVSRAGRERIVGAGFRALAASAGQAADAHTEEWTDMENRRVVLGGSPGGDASQGSARFHIGSHLIHSDASGLVSSSRHTRGR